MTNTCQWNPMCMNQAIGFLNHRGLGRVPICAHCLTLANR